MISVPGQCSYSQKAPSRLPHSPVWHVAGQRAPRSCAGDQILSVPAPAPFPSASDLGPAKMMCPRSHTSRQVAPELSRPHAARSLGFELLQCLLWRGKSLLTKGVQCAGFLLEFGATSCRQNVIFTCTGFNIQHEHQQHPAPFCLKKKNEVRKQEWEKEGRGNHTPVPRAYLTIRWSFRETR